MYRFFDFFLAFVALLTLSPLFFTVAIALRLTGEGEIFFKQSRVGRHASLFGLLKFATMLKDSPNIGTGTITVTGDPRVLPVGKFLRETKINELPQLLNILKGDMSVIGPRPQTQRCFDSYSAESKAEIVKVRPGLSGVGSIVFRDEERMMGDAENADRLYDEVIMPYKGALEEWYVANQGLKNYFLLIFLTVWVVVFPKSELHWKVLKGLPEAPEELQKYLGG